MKVEFVPAIDLLGGRSVRLAKGDYTQVTDYGDPNEQVEEFVGAGAAWIHLVDLDAARNKGESNRPAIAGLVSRGGARYEVGGGIRSAADAEELAGIGVERMVIGTKALRDPGFLAEMCAAHPGRIAAGLDYRRVDGRRLCALEGWEEQSDVELASAVVSAAKAGVSAVVVTDIPRDGMLSGPDVATYSELAALCHDLGIDLVASGGVSSLADLMALASIGGGGGAGLWGAISGKAIQEQRFRVEEAVELCKRFG